ncbi:carbohydrate ABC transporter permease [Mesorhizobium sp. NPDC059054]|uniref:carbohydrate ABC transporter permease n=1 Tax=unclassified Mesorhizobium TaxID=325217 RepID=UPI0036CF63A1
MHVPPGSNLDKANTVISGRSNHLRSDRTLGVLLIAPAALVVFIAMIVPLAYAVVMSFFDYKVGAEASARFIFLDNYLHFFGDRQAIKALVTTIVFSVSALALELVIGTLIAVMLMTIPSGLASFFRTVYTMPLLVSPIIIALIWTHMLDPSYGLVYYLLGLVGLDHVFGGLTQPGWALFSIVVVDVWQTTPFVLLVVTSGLSSISKEIYEAAEVDGAGPIRTLIQITLPLIVRVLIVITIIRGMDAFRVFDIIFGLTKGGPADSTLSLSIYAFRQGFDYHATGYAITISLFMMALLAIVFTPLMRFFNDENAPARVAR